MPWSLVSEGYAETTMHYSSQYSEAALKNLTYDKDSLIVDVACGPGTVPRLLAHKVKHIDALDFSENMINIVKEFCKSESVTNVNAVVGDGQDLPFKSNTYDCATSIFGLMFFPDRIKGFSELHRVLKPGGMAAVTSWAPVADSPAMQLMFGAVRAMNPDMPIPDNTIETLESPEVFEKEMELSGFLDIMIEPVEKDLTLNNIDDFWTFMEKGSAPIVLMKANASDSEWTEKVNLAMTYLNDLDLKFPLTLSAKAWIGYGAK